MPVTVEGVGTFPVPVGTPPEEIQRLANEFEQRQTPPNASRSPLSKATSMTADPHPAINKLLDLLPAAGGTVGGVLGAAGGTAFGTPFSGYPGAVGGATLGGATGEAARQLGRSILERPSPRSAGESALDIGKEAAIQGGIEAVGRVPGMGVKATGRQVFKGGLMEKAPETFGDLSELVKGGSIHPDKALQQAFALIKDLQKEAPFFMSQTAEKETLRKAAGGITTKEARDLSRKSRLITPEVTKAQRALVSMLDSVIAADPASRAAQTATQIKKLIGLSKAETATIGRTPSAGAAALGGLLGTTGGFASGGPLGALLGGGAGVGIPLFLGGHPAVQRALGKTAYQTGRVMAPALPAGARGLLELIRSAYGGNEEP